jgi:hypothetical protein
VIIALQIQEGAAHDRRAISLPTLNILDPVGSIKSIKDFLVGLFGGLIQAGQNAISLVEESKKGLESLAKAIEESVKTEIKAALNDTITKIKKAVDDSPIGTAIRVAECGEQGVKTAVSAAAKTGNRLLRVFQTADKVISLVPCFTTEFT